MIASGVGVADRPAAFTVAALLAALAGAKEPGELYPCAAYARLGTMDESGTVTRPTSVQEIAAGMARHCDYVLLGRFVSVSERNYDRLLVPPDEPVVSTFRVSEVLRGKAMTVAAIRLDENMLVAPGEDVSRYLHRLGNAENKVYRFELTTQIERELASIRDSGKPLTTSQHERLVDAVKRLVDVPPRTRREQHYMVRGRLLTSSPLSFHSELGAIRPGDLYLVGLDDEPTTGSSFRTAQEDQHDGHRDNENVTAWPIGSYVNVLHTYLFWGREALDIAAALREQRE